MIRSDPPAVLHQKQHSWADPWGPQPGTQYNVVRGENNSNPSRGSYLSDRKVALREQEAVASRDQYAMRSEEIIRYDKVHTRVPFANVLVKHVPQGGRVHRCKDGIARVLTRVSFHISNPVCHKRAEVVYKEERSAVIRSYHTAPHNLPTCARSRLRL